MDTKTCEYRTARRICVARVPEWILTTSHSLTSDNDLLVVLQKELVRQDALAKHLSNALTHD